MEKVTTSRHLNTTNYEGDSKYRTRKGASKQQRRKARQAIRYTK